MNTLDYLVIAAYLLLSLLLGCRVGRRQKNTEDYFLSGRQMKWWPVAIALFAALFSSISYIAMPGEAYNYGCTMLVSGLTGIIALPVMLFVFLKFFYNMKLWTVNEYLENRFSPAVRVICGGLFLGARCFYLGVVLYATAMLLANSFGISPWAGILVVGIVSTVYTYFGGMEAVIWTDVMQFAVLMGGILLVIGVVAWETPGGVGGIWNIAEEHNRTFNLGAESGFWEFNSTRRLTVWPLLIGLPFALFLPAIDQVNLQRCMTCRNFREVAMAVSWSTLGNWPICFIFYFAGLAVFAFYQVLHPELGAQLGGGRARGGHVDDQRGRKFARDCLDQGRLPEDAAARTRRHSLSPGGETDDSAARALRLSLRRHGAYGVPREKHSAAGGVERGTGNARNLHLDGLYARTADLPDECQGDDRRNCRRSAGYDLHLRVPLSACAAG